MGSILNQAIQILSATPVFSCFFFVSFTLSINHTFRRVKSHVSINLQVFVLITFLDFDWYFLYLGSFITDLHACFLKVAFFEFDFNYQFMIFLSSDLFIWSTIIKS